MVFYLPARIHLLIKITTAEPDAINKSPGQGPHTMTAFLNDGTQVEIIGMTVNDLWLVIDLKTGFEFEVPEEAFELVEF